MLGRPGRAPGSISTTASPSSKATPRRCRLPIASFDAYTIAFGIRNVTRIDLALSEALSRAQARRPVPVPGVLDGRGARASIALYDLFSFKVIPRLGRARDRRRRILSLSRREHPQISEASGVRGDDPRCRAFRASRCAKPDRRHRGVAFGLAFVISALTHITRLVRAGFVFAREGVFGAVDPSLRAAAAGSLRSAGATDRAGRRQAGTAAVTRAGAARARLTSSSASSWRPGRTSSAWRWRAISKRCRIACRHSRKPRPRPRSRPRWSARSIRLLQVSAPPVAAASIAQVHRGEIERDGVPQAVAVKVLRPERRARASAATSPTSFWVARHGRAILGGSAAPAADRSRRHHVALGRARDWICGWRPPRCRRWRRTREEIRTFACRPSTGTAPRHDVLTMEWIDGIALSRSCDGSRRRRSRSQATSAAR